MTEMHATPSIRSRGTAVALVAATYFYFLIYAEFAFLELASDLAGDRNRLRLIMLVLGAGGIMGAFLAAAGFRPQHAASMLTWTLRACAVGGLVALVSSHRAGIMLAAAVSGAGLGAGTVVLASVLREAAGARVGLSIGIGTGVAYALCNLPGVFRAPPATQTWMAVLAVSAASFLPRRICVRGLAPPEPRTGESGVIARWVAILLALVWLDSAAFYIVQHTSSLRGATWSGTGMLLGNASIHLLSAVISGLMLDRGARGLVALIAMANLAAAGLMLNGTLPAGALAVWFYTAGVSFYSVLLVEFPARTGRPAIAALVFAVAGWIGSALGIGMAQDLSRIPTWFVAAAVALAAVALGWRSRAVRVAIVVVAALGLVRADELKLGREVYIAEGCIHCHSQYIRPRVASEVLNWGPAKPLSEALAAEPPLFGTRRQGPDLANVGNRRSAEWNRLHLTNPQAVSPGSRMPTYAHLFADGDERGPALVAYLASLGADSFERRQQQVAHWRPVAREIVSPEAAGQLFHRLCVPCHGEAGHGDGRLASGLSVRPPDWTAEPWRRVPPGPEVDAALSRIIKFGVPGSPMAGHEYLTDAEIVGLARFVRSLHKTDGNAAVQP